MASSSTLPLCTTKTPFSSFTNSSFFAKPSQHFLHGKRNQSFKVSCTGEHEGNQLDAIKEGAVDRRNVILGLGGLYGAANLAPLASAAPVPPPDLTTCSNAIITGAPVDCDKVPYTCCPPKPDDMSKVPYYKIPRMSKLRKRPAAQNVTEEYIAKYQLATSKMKELDKDPSDPLGFKQQANIHCAYCNLAYTMGDQKLQVHESWLFFPFHRWYLYFYERILGTLIDDPTFALPYWNWDHPKGMRLPPMFDVEGSSLYDAKRNPHVRNGTIIDLGFFGDKVEYNEIQLINNNLNLMYRQMITNAPCPLLFFGKPYRLGSKPDPGQGTIENIPHTPVHIWTGTVRHNDKHEFGEDMGNFYSAGLDPVFYCHHANVDRMWNEWKALGGKRRDLTDPDWLNSEFFFYDENRDPWLVKVRDCLDSKKMGYDYERTATPWRNYKPGKKSTKGKVNPSSCKPASKVFPLLNLDRAICFSIERPATSRSQQEKDEKEEMLIFKDLKYDDREYIRFDVYINADKTVKPDDFDLKEYAGSYTSLPHVHAPNNANHVIIPKEFKLAITELLEECDLEDDDIIAVAVVPKKGGEVVSINSVEIGLEDCYSY